MDNADKVLSTERDITYVNQAEELALDAWEKLSTRTSGRGAVMPYTQLLGDANPAGSKHWILERSKNGKLRLIKTTHKDNPTIYNEDGTLTENGARRLEALNNLSGVRRKRLFLGEWATAEGAVYDMFDPEIHVVERDPKEFKDFGLAIDWGYVHPSVILLFGIDGDDRLHIIREFYKTGQLQETVVKTAREWFFNPCTSDDPDFHPKCTMIVVDEHASGLIADLRNNSLPAMPAGGKITHGIASIQNRLKIQGDGKPRITVDPSCVNTINEFESWEWKPGKDEPLDIGDDAMDCVRYFDSAFAPVQLFF
jgi:phage terminase large subunit